LPFSEDGSIVLTLWQQSDGKLRRMCQAASPVFQVGTIDDVQHIEHKLHEMNARFLYDGIVTHAEGMQSGVSILKTPTASASKFSAQRGGRPRCSIARAILRAV
jgi:hypothetical protein